MREITFVGNGPTGDVAGRIDAADHVVRFNRAAGFGGRTGTRTDDLFLVNVGGQMFEWLGRPGFWTSPPLRAARTVTLPVAAERPVSGLALRPRLGAEARHGINYEHDVRRRMEGRRVRVVPDRVRLGAIRALRDLGPAPTRRVWPSTGFLALFWYDRLLPPGARITLHGFGFRGAACHHWDRERAWARARAATGRLRLEGVPA